MRKHSWSSLEFVFTLKELQGHLIWKRWIFPKLLKDREKSLQIEVRSKMGLFGSNVDEQLSTYLTLILASFWSYVVRLGLKTV